MTLEKAGTSYVLTVQEHVFVAATFELVAQIASRYDSQLTSRGDLTCAAEELNQLIASLQTQLAFSGPAEHAADADSEQLGFTFAPRMHSAGEKQADGQLRHIHLEFAMSNLRLRRLMSSHSHSQNVAAPDRQNAKESAPRLRLVTE